MSRPAKRRRISDEDNASSPPPPNNPGATSSAFAKSAAKWDLEQAYEQRPRKNKTDKTNGRLPVRTETGWIEQERSPISDDDVEDSFLASGDEGDVKSLDSDQESAADETPAVPLKQQIRQAKEELARCAGLVNEDPEEHIGTLRTISHFAESPVVPIKKLALATQLAVYKDIIPGYRIRPNNEDDSGVKLSKEVRRLRNFEQSLVGGYQQYLKTLAAYAKHSKADATEDSASLATVAISCACNLLTAVPHFNFRGELLNILVAKVSTKRKDADFYRCIEALETLFRTDEDGNASMEAVAMLTKMIKAKDYLVDEAVLNTFLHLRLLSEFSQKASRSGVDKAADESGAKGKKQKEKREFRTKRQRKLMREQKGIEKEMKEADAAVSHEERERMQAESLKLVFVTYFRILKARTPSLMGAVLEGLARYAHLINQDFFGDILEALRDLISRRATPAGDEEELEDDEDAALDEEAHRNASRESLLCVITAFALLEGQDASSAASSLSLDLNFFITHLYQSLFSASLDADVESSLRRPAPADADTSKPRSQNKVNIQTTAVLLLRSLNSALLPPHNLRAVPPTRVAAFAKNLMTVSLQLPEKSCLAMMQLLQKVIKIHGRKVAALWHTEERKGDGVFDPMKGEGGGEGSNPFATTVWEGELLRRHFCPSVRDSAKALETGVVKSRS
ncbi:MAG: hypothetical protein INR71_01515 [Terriglobus roseus]|nr:hypothetical protein [Terriglobus roseus]